MDVSERQRMLSLPATLESARQARRYVLVELRRLDLEELADAAQVAVSELVTNGVLHARTPLQLTLRTIDDGIRVTVHDGNPALPELRSYGRDAITGRGLKLVAALTDEVGVDPDGDGKTVWFTLTRARVRGEAEAPREWNLDELLHDQQELDAERIADAAVPVAVLEGLPVRLWRAAQQYHDAALRELMLHLAGTGDVPGADRVTAATAAQAVLAATIARAIPAPVDGEPDRTAVDVPVEVTDDLAAAALVLQDVLDEGDRLAAAEQLLLPPALPEVVALRDWCCGQLVAQANGAPPVPWSGHEPSAVSRPTVPLPAWDDGMVVRSGRAVLAVDDQNRLVAVSPAAARLLGWDAAALTGRRVTALVPPELREKHVAGFTRHLAGGEDHIIGVDLELPVLRGDGAAVTVGMRIERAPAAAGRTVYVAWLTPAA